MSLRSVFQAKCFHLATLRVTFEWIRASPGTMSLRSRNKSGAIFKFKLLRPDLNETWKSLERPPEKYDSGFARKPLRSHSLTQHGSSSGISRKALRTGRWLWSQSKATQTKSSGTTSKLVSGVMRSERHSCRKRSFEYRSGISRKSRGGARSTRSH